MQCAILDCIFYTFLPQITTLFLSITCSLNFHWNTAQIADESNILSRLIFVSDTCRKRSRENLKMNKNGPN